MKVAILGTRGIPNHYGGFEQLAEYLAAGLQQRGHEVIVYCSSLHPYKADEWKGIRLVHCYDPEDKLGTFGQFIYDFNCIRHSRTQNFDLILQLGYTSNSVWHFLLPEKPVIITNMDGLEWKRTKYSAKVQRFLKYAEKLAVQSSDLLVADSVGIRDYLKTAYGADSTFIPYGADVHDSGDRAVPAAFGLEPGNYLMAIARFEPENNIETIIKGYLRAKSGIPLLLVGSYANKYGAYLEKKYRSEKVIFAGPVYDLSKLNALRFFSLLYFHGHTVGGTNPSLLEAMASRALVCANDNIFNRSVLGNDALYFADETGVADAINQAGGFNERPLYLENNVKKIRQQYSWPHIVDEYEKLMLSSFKK